MLADFVPKIDRKQTMDDFKQWLARVLLNCASGLLQTRFAFDASRRWKFDSDWEQPVSDCDQSVQGVQQGDNE